MKRTFIAALLLFTIPAQAFADESELLLASTLERPDNRETVPSAEPWLILGHGRIFPPGESGSGEISRVGLGFDILRPLPLGLEVSYNDFSDDSLADGRYATVELAPRYDMGALRLFGRIGAGTPNRDLDRIGATYAAGAEYVIGTVPYTWKLRLEWARFARIEYVDGETDRLDAATVNLIVAH